jgi:hypothetical protein
MDENDLKQFFRELIQSTGDAIGYFAAAVARTGNSRQLTEEMRAQIQAAIATQQPQLTIRLANLVLASLETEAMIDEASNTRQ